MPFIVDRPSRPKPKLRLNLGDKDDRARFFKHWEPPVDKEHSQIRVKKYKGHLSDSLNLALAPIEKIAGYRAQNIVRGHQPLPSQRLQPLLNALPRLNTTSSSFQMQGLLDGLPRLDTGQQSQTTTSSDESDEPDCYFSLGDGWEHFVTPPAPIPVPAPAPIPVQAPIAPPARNGNLVDSGGNAAGWVETPDPIRVKPIRPPPSTTTKSTAFDWLSVLNRELNLLHRDMYRFDQVQERNELLLQRQRPADRNARLSRFAAYLASMRREERILLDAEASMRRTHVDIVINPDYQAWRMRTTRNKLERAIDERFRRVQWARGYLDTVDLTTHSIW